MCKFYCVMTNEKIKICLVRKNKIRRKQILFSKRKKKIQNKKSNKKPLFIKVNLNAFKHS